MKSRYTRYTTKQLENVSVLFTVRRPPETDLETLREELEAIFSTYHVSYMMLDVRMNRMKDLCVYMMVQRDLEYIVEVVYKHLNRGNSNNTSTSNSNSTVTYIVLSS